MATHTSALSSAVWLWKLIPQGLVSGWSVSFSTLSSWKASSLTRVCLTITISSLVSFHATQHISSVYYCVVFVVCVFVSLLLWWWWWWCSIHNIIEFLVWICISTGSWFNLINATYIHFFKRPFLFPSLKTYENWKSHMENAQLYQYPSYGPVMSCVLYQPAYLFKVIEILLFSFLSLLKRPSLFPHTVSCLSRGMYASSAQPAAYNVFWGGGGPS